MERLLVVGSSGLLGNRLVTLGKGRFEVFGTYNKNVNNTEGNYRLDVCNRESVLRLVEKIKPDCVIDTHGLNNLDYCETHPEESWSVNVDGSKNVAEACKKQGCKYMYISTDDVFDGRKLRYTEKDKPHPLNYYAKTKLVMEYTLAALDTNYIIARSSVLYGTGGIRKPSFVVWLISKLRNREKVRIVTDQKNNPTFTDSLSEFLFRLYEKGETGIFHVAGKDCISRYDFSMEIARQFGLEGRLITPITSPELNQIAHRPASVNMVSEKAERAAGLGSVGIKEGLSLLKKQLGE